MRKGSKLLAVMTVLSFSSVALAQTGATVVPATGWLLVGAWIAAMLRLFFGVDLFFGLFGNG